MNCFKRERVNMSTVGGWASARQTLLPPLNTNMRKESRLSWRHAAGRGPGSAWWWPPSLAAPHIKRAIRVRMGVCLTPQQPCPHQHTPASNPHKRRTGSESAGGQRGGGELQDRSSLKVELLRFPSLFYRASMQQPAPAHACRPHRAVGVRCAGLLGMHNAGTAAGLRAGTKVCVLLSSSPLCVNYDK